MKKALLLVLSVAALAFYFNFTIFVVQPIGALPDGRTLLVSRQGQLQFVDSADAMCERTQGGVSLFCRMAALARVSHTR
jgi:hypothetical protein